MREVTFAATQMACSNNSKDNIDQAVNLIEQAAKEIVSKIAANLNDS